MLPSTIWGPTADSHDLIVKNILLPELYIGDWLVWKNMGAYTLSLANKFNGFPIPHVIPFIRKSQWLVFVKISVLLKIFSIFIYYTVYNKDSLKIFPSKVNNISIFLGWIFCRKKKT